MPKLIDVPQGCYAELTPSLANDEVEGFYTYGMGSCCHIIVYNKSTGYMLLCHADQSTDLADTEHGIKAWVNRATNYREARDELIINIGEGVGESHGEASVESGNTYYEQVIKNIPQWAKSCIVVQSNAKNQVTDTIAVTKNDGIIGFYDKVDLEYRFVEPKDCPIQKLVLSHITDKPDFAGAFIDARAYALSKYNEENQNRLPPNRLFPAASVYDGYSNEFLTLDEIKNRYNQTAETRPVQINWVRVESNTRSRDVTPLTMNPASSRNPSESELEDTYTPDFESESTGSNKSNTSIPEDNNIIQGSETDSSIAEDNNINPELETDISISEEDKHLVRAEKKGISQVIKPKFTELLSIGLITKEKELLRNIENNLNFSASSQFLLSNKEESKNSSAAIMPENNHRIDHPKNITMLSNMLDTGEIKPNTVICLERKEEGQNFGMRDVALLAAILEHNVNSEECINIPKAVQESMIYQDALLYNKAKALGVQVIGIEGKRLKHNKDSPLYNQSREEFMAARINKLTESGKDVIVLVGSRHVTGLEEKLTADIKPLKTKIRKDKNFSQISFQSRLEALLSKGPPAQVTQACYQKKKKSTSLAK